jgi:hypothetical protein
VLKLAGSTAVAAAYTTALIFISIVLAAIC